MLWSLAAAAAGGAIAALSGTTDVMWRMVGTTVLMAVCAGALLLVSRFLFEPDPAPGLMATGVVLAEFGLGIAAIWEILNRLGPPQVYYLIPIVLFTGVPATILLKFRRSPSGKVAVIAGLAICVVVFVIWVVDIWLPWTNSQQEKVWLYGLMLYALGFPITGCLIAAGKDRWHWRWIGVGCEIVAYAISVRQVAIDKPRSQPLVALISIGAIIAYANIMRRVLVRKDQKWLPRIAILIMSAAVVVLNVAVWQHEHYRIDSFVLPADRAAAAVGIVAACATLAVAVLVSINRRAAPIAKPDPQLIAAMEVQIACPVCHHKQTYGKEGGACAVCGLRVRIAVEEPRCPVCQYSLLMFKGDHCPECGAPCGIERGPIAPAVIPTPNLHKSPG
jgi:uncharacterized membrane protein (DUF373 family)